MPTPRLRDYRAKLTPGTTLGFAYTIFDPSYNEYRDVNPSRLTVVAVNGPNVVFQRPDQHQVLVGLDTSLSYLCFGPGPYLPEYNILTLPPLKS